MAAIERRPRRAPSPAVGPDGIPAGARRRTGSLHQVFVACAAGAVVLALLAPPDLPSWAERLGDGPLAGRLREAASACEKEVARLDLTLPHQALRRATRWLMERRWP